MRKLKCKYCKRIVPNKSWITKNGCKWCNVKNKKLYSKQYNILNSELEKEKSKVTFRIISIKNKKDKIFTWNPRDIDYITIYRNKIIINRSVLRKNNYYYSNWESFVIKLTTIFNIERI